MSPDTASVHLPAPAGRVAIVSFVLVFLCGAVFGAVLMSVSGHAGLHDAARAAQPPASGLSMSVGDWKRQLDLSDEQAMQLTSILDDFSRYYDNVLADGNSRIMQILNPEQRRRFQQMLRDRKR
jgi:Spy/CpxP family protein refolding chaperone